MYSGITSWIGEITLNGNDDNRTIETEYRYLVAKPRSWKLNGTFR